MARTPTTIRLDGSSALNYNIETGTLFEDFETFGDWSKQSAGGTIADETTIVRSGSHSLKLTSGASTNCYADKTISTNFGSVGVLSFWVYVPSLTDLTSIAIYISSTTNYSKYFLITIQGASLHEGWNKVNIGNDEWTNSGGESWENTMLRLRVRVNSSTGSPVVYFDSLYVNTYSRPKVLFTFDDGWDSQYSEAYTYMATKGLKGTVYVIGSRVGTANYMTLANLQTLYDAGWDLGTHGDTNLTTFGTQAEMEAEIASNRDFLITNGFTRNNCHLHYAYPNGGYNDTAKAALSSLGFLTARTIVDATQPHVFTENLLLNRWAVLNTTSVANAKAFIDNAIKRGGSVLLNYHILVAATADTSTKVLNADFEAVVDYATLKQPLADVVTVTEWYRGLTNPRKLV